MKSKIKRTRRVQFPATGVQTDIEALLQKFVDSKSIRFEVFSRLWREGNYSLIHAGRQGMREKREFMEEAFKIIFKFALPPYSLQVRVGALYTLYGMYYTQRLKCKVKVRVPLSCWQDIKGLHEEVTTHQHLDVDYIIRKMMHDDVFEFVAYPSPLTIDDFYKNEDDDDDCEEVVEESDLNLWGKDENTLNKLLDEDSLGQLNAVHSKYHQLKCQLHANLGGDPNAPSSSLDLIQPDLVDTIVNIAKPPEAATLSSPKQIGKQKKKKQSKKTNERASRISEIKQRALTSKIQSDSGALRFLNPAEKSPEIEPETIPTSKKRTPKINKRTVRTRTPVKTDEFVEFVKNHTQNSKEKQEKEKKNKSEHKTTKKKGKRKQRSKNVSSSSEYGSSDTDFSDHDLITGLISSTEQQSNPTKKRSSFRKSGKIRESLADSASDDSDHDDDFPNDDGDDDDYNVEKDCNDLLKQSRITQWSLKRKKRSSLDETPDTPSNSQQIAKSSPSLQNTVDCSNQSPIPVESRDRSGISSEDSTSVNLTSDNDIETNSPKQKKPKLKTPISVPTANESKEIKVQENEMVALKPDQVWLDRPLVGRIVSVRNDELEVIWYFGGYTTKWREWSLAEGDKVKVQRDTVSRERVLMESFQLTSSKKIPAKTAKQLRSMYKVLDKK